MIDLTLAPPWGQFRLCPALLWASDGSIGALLDHTLDSTLAYEADCGSLWCQFRITLGRVGVALTSLWGHFAHLGVGLGSLWADFGLTLGRLWINSGPTLDRLGPTFGTLKQQLHHGVHCEF